MGVQGAWVMSDGWFSIKFLANVWVSGANGLLRFGFFKMVSFLGFGFNFGSIWMVVLLEAETFSSVLFYVFSGFWVPLCCRLNGVFG